LVGERIWWDRAALVPPYSETASFFGCHFSKIPRFDVLIEPPFRAGFPCALYIRATAYLILELECSRTSGLVSRKIFAHRFYSFRKMRLAKELEHEKIRIFAEKSTAVFGLARRFSEKGFRKPL